MKIQPVLKKYHPGLKDTYMASLKNQPDTYAKFDQIVTGKIDYFGFEDRQCNCTIVFKCYIL